MNYASKLETRKPPQRVRLVSKVRLAVAPPDTRRGMAADGVKHLLRYPGAIAKLLERVPPSMVRL